MSSKKIKLLLADVDGTLVTHDKILTNAAREVIADLPRFDIRFAITSGRPPRGMKMLIEPLNIVTPLAGFNGGVFVDRALAPIESHCLDADVAKETIDLLEAAGLDVWLYTERDWFIRKKEAPHVEREAWTVKYDAKVVPEYTETHLNDSVKIVGVSDDHALMRSTEALAQKTLGARASASLSQPYYLDVTHPKANKGTVVESLSRFLNIPADEIATIGDMPNDVLMFRKSGFSIAMGNANPDVQAHADVVTDTNENEGFAKAVREHILG